MGDLHGWQRLHYLWLVPLIFISLWYIDVREWIRVRTKPKLRHMNWLRKLAGLPLK
jgi:hypothetical protein